MNSFDLWDTLVAGRDTAIAAGNQPGYFPIAENIAKVRPDDIIISDYEDGMRAIKVVREIGLQNNVIVTPDGKWNGWVWDKAPRKPQLHLGDNLKADVESPARFGIKAAQTLLHKMTEPEQYINDAGFHKLACACREARLRTYSPEFRGLEILQCDYNFPVLVLASAVLNRRYPDNELLMSARDCWQWVQILRKLYGRGTYWYTSVIARENADENYHKYIRSFKDPLLVDLCGTGTSFSKLPQYPSVLLYRPDHGIQSIPAIISSPACYRLEQANVAPHEKCSGVDADLNPVFINRSGTDFSKERHTAAQANAFKVCLKTLDDRNLSEELKAPEGLCREVMHRLMHQYINFAEAVSGLRALAIADDKEPV